ncbi:extensin-like [Lycium barbarum]|uniref:extensin-like n=1 Tax=Lycium barbarum TaxID=112863 RepID=UPI00293E12AC|nr:extensin-like [Lycium barbarum]
MSNQQRPFSWLRLAPFGRQMQPAPVPAPAPAPAPTATRRPTAFRAPAPQPFRPPTPRPRPTVRPPAPTVTSPPPPTRALFPGITTTTPRSPTPSTVPSSPAKSTPATSAPASPISKMASSSSPTSPTGTSTFLPITSSSFNLRSPETKKPTPYSPSPKPAASPPKTAPPATVTAPTTETTPVSSRMIKPLSESPPKYPKTKPLFHPPTQARAAPQEEKKLMLGQEAAGNSKMNEKAAIDNKKVTEVKKLLPRRLVTLIGENKGAVMVLNPNSTKKSHTNVFGGKSQTVGKKEEGNTVEGEMGSKKKKEDQSDMNTMEMEESTLFINNNVQGVNNSILDDSSLTHHDPGFHILFSTD